MKKKPETRKKTKKTVKKRLSLKEVLEKEVSQLDSFDWKVIRASVRKKRDDVYEDLSRGRSGAMSHIHEGDLEMLHRLLTKIEHIVSVYEPRVKFPPFK